MIISTRIFVAFVIEHFFAFCPSSIHDMHVDVESCARAHRSYFFFHLKSHKITVINIFERFFTSHTLRWTARRERARGAERRNGLPKTSHKLFTTLHFGALIYTHLYIFKSQADWLTSWTSVCVCECLFVHVNILPENFPFLFDSFSLVLFACFFRYSIFFSSFFLLYSSFFWLSLSLVFVYFSCTRFIWFAHRATTAIIIINIIIVIHIEYMLTFIQSKWISGIASFFLSALLLLSYCSHPLLPHAYGIHAPTEIKNILHSFNIQNIVKSWHFEKTIQCFVCALCAVCVCVWTRNRCHTIKENEWQNTRTTQTHRRRQTITE